MKKIEIKAYFSGWKEVDETTAIRFVKGLKDRMICPESQKNQLINTYHLRGISCDELLSK